MRILSRFEIADKFRELARERGEEVWDQHVHLPDRRYFMPLLWTSLIAKKFEHGVLSADDPGSWVVDIDPCGNWKLYIRIGEKFSEGGVQVFKAPVEVGVRSDDEFTCLRPIPARDYWQAEFVCPYCEFQCAAGRSCPHLMVAAHWVLPPFRSTRLVDLLKKMGDRVFICNALNMTTPGLKIKLPRVLIQAEWFRFAYWYIEDPRYLEPVLDRLSTALDDVSTVCAR